MNNNKEYLQEIEKFKAQLKKLKYAWEFVQYMNAYECPKCHHYNVEGYICHHCGFDRTDSEYSEEI